MTNAIVTACLPAAAALTVACVLVTVPIRLSGGRWQWSRLRSLHGCERGGVQTLSFVLTLPAFIMIAMFIVQVSQLMVAIVLVNYAAFATARAASVWIPAEVIGTRQVIYEPGNLLPEPIAPNRPVLLSFNERLLPPHDPDVAVWEYDARSSTPRSSKYASIFTAAAMACAPLGPSRDYGYFNDLQNAVVADAAKKLYAATVPSSAANSRVPQRIENKIAYSFMSTAVLLRFKNVSSYNGPTYNPRQTLMLRQGRPPNVRYIRHSWQPNMVDWQDPITVTVMHEFLLLPGPGRFLAAYLVRADEQPDEVSPRIRERLLLQKHRIYTTAIWASATITNEGLLSVFPYVESRVSSDVSFADNSLIGKAGIDGADEEGGFDDDDLD